MALTKQEFESLHEFLDREAMRINTVDFIANDPVQFPRRFSALRDIEIVSLLSATIAWGNRKMICNNCHKMLTIMGNDPAAFVSAKAYEELPDELNIHRTFFARNFKYMLRGLNHIYGKYDSLNDFALAQRVGESDTPAWLLVEHMQQQFALQSQLAQCCCDNRAATADLKYTAATENCADRTAALQNTRDIIDSQTRSTQAILDKLCALELDGVKSQLAAAQRENVGLQNQLNMATMAASQAAQTATFQQGLNDEVDALYNRLKNCPVNTVPVYGNQPIFTYANGCGCGCGMSA